MSKPASGYQVGATACEGGVTDVEVADEVVILSSTALLEVRQRKKVKADVSCGICW